MGNKHWLVSIAVAVLVFLACGGEKSTEPDGSQTEPPELKAFTSYATEVLLGGDKDSMLAITDEEYASVIHQDVPDDSVAIAKLGRAIASRKLLYATSLYAEYEVTIDGVKYTVAFAQGGDGEWKLLRY